ncbi:hypothetical protein COCNU_08G004000 [Cocos nucifera]|uniref:BIG2 domain-containing protein n=1 Tax=Cocos nucifera TaxID=13894 RepID=A0A8K0IHC4_COCNU|nr:hypothetical protein COCNU_08G004000 [Cocos nucifera]
MGFPAAAVGAAVLAVVVAAALASLPPLVVAEVSGPHIAELNVLLPPRMTNPVGYRLQGSDGCFSWSWDHHDILSVQPEYNVSSRCSTSAQLISIAPYNGRKETAVYATDLHSGITIRCKVFIDEISRIQIFHHAIKIDLDELATLRIRAFDDEENVFSSLVGLQFLWTLVPKSSEDDTSHYLVHVPLKETPLSDCGGFCGDLHTQIELEDRDIGSDLYVVKGIGIGHEVVSAQLLEPKLEHVMDTIVLTVAEAMSLDPPSPVFVTVGALIYYSLRVIRLNAAQADTVMPLVEYSMDGHLIFANWNIEDVQKLLELFISVMFDKNNDLKLESDAPRYWDLFSVSKDVAIKYNWQNSRLLKPVSPGRGYLTASLTYEKGNSEMAEVLQVVQEVNVCNKVKLIFGEDNEYSQIIHLPWAPGVYQEAQLKATGGCGKTLQDYKWSSSDKATVSISVSGVVKAKRPGQVIIRVFSVFDSMNYDEVVIEVSVPSSMVMLPIFPVEVVVGTEIQAAVTLKTSTGVYFHRCDAFSSFARWNVFSESECFRVIDKTGKAWPLDMLPHTEGSKPLYGYPCAWTYLHASGAGRAMLHATMSSESQSSFQFLDGPIILKAASPIAAYYPLAVYQAQNGNHFGGYWVDLSRIFAGIQDSDGTSLNKLYLVPGSGMDVLLLGGPERWDHGVDFVETVNILGEPNSSVINAVIVQQASSSGGRQYKIFCQSLGNYKLLFSRGNLVGADHPVPAIAQVELSVICSFPSSIVLLANEPANMLDTIEAASNADRGPGRLRTAPVIVSNGCTIRLAAVGIHKTRRAFANSSSLCLRWELSGCKDLAHWSDTNSLERSEATWERFLVLHNASGLCTVRATVVGFPETMASHLYEKAFSWLERAEAALTDAIHLQLVSSLRVVPEFVLLVFDPEAKVNLSVTGGTCFLDAVTNDTQVAFIIQPPESTQCSHLIVGARGLGSALVTVRDIGLSPPAAASALVRVAEVDWIKIIPEQELSLMEGTTERFDILTGTHDGCIFDFSQYVYMKIKVHLEDGILELISENYSPINGEWVVFGPKFSVRALNIGITTLYVSVKQKSGYELLSQLVKVEVYKPLQLHPEYIYLVPGASYLLTVKGGPKIGASVEYASMNEGIAVVQKSLGKLSANSMGNATVQAAIYGNGGILICEAYGRVEVGIPSAMTLNLQSDQLCIGCKMPVFPTIPEASCVGDLFSFYEICKDYKWMVENEKYVYMKIKVHLEDGILELISENYSPINGEWVVFGPKFSVRALNIGITTLYVSVKQKSGYELLSQLVKVEVYKPLQLHPEYIYLVPGASYLLTVKGGPKIGASVEYASMNEGIAVVQKSLGKLSANSMGNATVQAAIYGNGGILICEAYGRVEVGIPSAMTLNLQSDQLCIGCKMPVFPTIPEASCVGDLFSFYEICKDYKWMVENEKVVSFETATSLHSDVHKASLSCLGNNNPCYSDDRDDGFINVLIGRSAGKARVSISISCDFVLNGYPQPVSYNASKSLTVVSDPPLALGIPITWILPPFYTSSELLPRSSDSYGQVDSHKHKATTYSMLRACEGNSLLRQEGITIDGSKIRTKESDDLDCIEANDRSTGRTVIASCVRTAQVSQVRVTTPESSFHMAYLPVNAKMELIISYADDLGYPFSEAFGVVPLDIETNNPDVVSAFMSKADESMHGSSEHVTLQAKRPGKALVRISINHNPRKADFMLVSVGARLYPRNPVLHVGRYLNFSVLGDGLDGLQSGQWLTSNESVLSVNRLTGESQARDEGTAEVIFEGMNLKLQTTVTVLKVEQIIVDAPTETLTNIQFPPKGYKFLVRFSDSLGYKFEAPRNQLEVLYDCKVDPPYVGYAKPWSDHVTGSSYCLFFPYSPKRLLSLMSKSNVRLEETASNRGFIYVSIIASLREAPYIMGSAHALFVGGFSIPEVGKVVNLTPDSNKSLITLLFVVVEVEVYWNAKDLLLVSPISIVGFGFGGHTEYEVKVLKNQRFTDKITIVLPATGQTEEIDVSYELGERTAPAGISEITWSAVVVCAVVLILTNAFMLRKSFIYADIGDYTWRNEANNDGGSELAEERIEWRVDNSGAGIGRSNISFSQNIADC